MSEDLKDSHRWRGRIRNNSPRIIYNCWNCCIDNVNKLVDIILLSISQSIKQLKVCTWCDQSSQEACLVYSTNCDDGTLEENRWGVLQWSPVSIQTQSLALASSQSWLPLLRPSIPIGWRLRFLRENKRKRLRFLRFSFTQRIKPITRILWIQHFFLQFSNHSINSYYDIMINNV